LDLEEEAALLVRTVATEIRLEVVCSGGRATSLRQRPAVRSKYEGYTCGADPLLLREGKEVVA